MDQSPQFYNSNQQGPQGVQSPIPTPPSPEEKVAVRTMETDLESVKQTGGESPQPEIMSAPQVATARMQDVPPAPSYQPQPNAYLDQNQPAPIPSMPPTPATTVNYSAPVAEEPTLPIPEQTPSKSSFSIKTILLIVGIIIVAGLIGYGFYYFTSSLKQEAEIPAPSTNDTAVLPIEEPVQQPVVPNPVVPEPTPPVIQPLVHKSIIPAPNKTEVVAVAETSLPGFKSAISKASTEKLISGNIKDLSFVDSANAPIEASTIISALLPTSASVLTSLVDRDFTSWLYGDKVGGNKFGLIFKLKEGISVNQARSSFMPVIESSVTDVQNLFIATVTPPTPFEYKEGQIENVSVRFGVFNAKTGNVFEYAWYSIGADNYLVMATSYNQMLSTMKILKTIPVATAPIITPVSTTTTAGTSTVNP